MDVLGILLWCITVVVWCWAAFIVLAGINHWGRLAKWEVVTHPYEDDQISVVEGTYRWRWAAERAQRRMNSNRLVQDAIWHLVPSEEAFLRQK